MKTFRFLLCLITIGASSSALAQSKGEMPFTSSSPNANQLIRKAWVAMSDAKMEEGNQYLQQVLEEDPTCAMAYVSLAASADDGAENVTKAEAMKLSPDETLFIKGLRASRESSEAHTYFAPLLKKYPKDDYLHFIVMFFLYKQGPGIAIGENIVNRNPKFAPVHNLLGYEYMGQNDLTKALYHFEKYISMKPDLANPYDSKGDFLMHTGKTDEAIKLYEKASSLGMAASKAKAEDAKAKLKYPVLSAGDEAEIKAILSASIDAYEQGDAEALLKDYSPQSVKIWGTRR
jgi:tetratricopeptide (TPR) repeat protein